LVGKIKSTIFRYKQTIIKTTIEMVKEFAPLGIIGLCLTAAFIFFLYVISKDLISKDEPIKNK
jgi:hypothetical protein